MVAKTLTIKPAHLHRPVGQVVRLLMRKRLALADALLDDLHEPEAVHEFRVALRRARSIERAYRPYLSDVISRKLRRRLKAVVAATGAARDTEVQLQRLARRRADTKPHQQPGFDWLQARLEQRLEAEYAQLRTTLAERFRLVHKPLQARLKAKTKAPEPDFSQVTAGLILEATIEFALGCAQLRRSFAQDPLHAARISGKRLRYLLEPLSSVLPEAEAPVATLKMLQDLLGEIHDLQVFGLELMEAAEEAGAARLHKLIALSLTLPIEAPELEQARQQDERAGLMSLARELQTRQTDLVEHLRARLAAGEAEDLATRIRQLAADCLHAAPQVELHAS